MKGISAIIATILMLLITIALAGTAYLFITGTFNRYTSVVLGVNGQLTTCASSGGAITAYVDNNGQNPTGAVSIDLTCPNGTTIVADCSIATIPAGGTNSTSCARTLCVNQGQGSYTLVAHSGGSAATGPVACNS